MSAVRSTMVMEMPSMPMKYSTLSERIQTPVLDELVAVVTVGFVEAGVEMQVEPRREDEVHAHDAEREPPDGGVVFVAGEMGEEDEDHAEHAGGR